MKLGTAKYGAKTAYSKVKDGTQIFRILPPMGDLADDGIWSTYCRINYGYTNEEGKSRPFESCLKTNGKKGKDRKVEVPDAAVERYDKLKAAYDAAAKAGDQKTKDSLVGLVGGAKSRYNVDSNHYMKVVDLQGNLSILKVRHKCKQQLDIAIRALRDKGVDPLSVDNGRFFAFTRTGTGQETTFSVSVYKQTINVEGVGEVERDYVHKLDEALIKRLKSEVGMDLNKLFKKPTASQIDQIVKESDLKSGKSPNIDAILNYKAEESAGDGDQEGDDSDLDQGASETVGNQPKETAASAPPQETKQEAKPEPTPAPAAEKAKKAASKKAEAAPAAAPAQTAPAVPQTTAEKISDMSEDEFLKSLGLG